MEKFYILNEIGGWGVLPEDLQRFLNNNRGKAVEIVINSPGGYIDDGVAMFNMLKLHDGKVTTRAVSQVASIASVVFLAGEDRIIETGAWLMVHKPWMYAAGDANDLRKNADYLDTMQAAIMNIYNEVVTAEPADIEAMVDAETWMLGEEATAHGFATVAEQKIYAVASAISHDLSKYTNVPQALNRSRSEQPKKIDKGENKGQGTKPAENNTQQIQEDTTMDISKATAQNVQEENPALYQAIASAGKNQEQERVKSLKGLAMAAAAAPEAVQVAVNKEIDTLLLDPEATAENSTVKIITAMSTAQAAVEESVGANARNLGRDADELDAGEEAQEEEVAEAEAKNRVSGIAAGLK